MLSGLRLRYNVMKNIENLFKNYWKSCGKILHINIKYAIIQKVHKKYTPIAIALMLLCKFVAELIM